MSAELKRVIAIDIALEPDAAMTARAEAANDRVRASYPKGFAFDATHRPHLTLLQQFIRAADLNRISAAANAVLANEQPANWSLSAIKYSYGASPPVGSVSLVIEPTEHLRRLQDELLAAVAPFNLRAGTPAAFYSDDNGRDIAEFVLGYVANFAKVAAGESFNPHVTVGVGRPSDVAEMLAEPFEPFPFSPAGAAIYQLGAFGTARKELQRLTMTTGSR